MRCVCEVLNYDVAEVRREVQQWLDGLSMKRPGRRFFRGGKARKRATAGAINVSGSIWRVRFDEPPIPSG